STASASTATCTRRPPKCSKLSTTNRKRIPMDTITVNGLTFSVNLEYDDCHGAPWEECDGHGPVSDWTSRNKLPGERILNRDRGMYRYYDVAEATRIAKRDSWGIGPDAHATLAARLGREPTAGEIAAAAVESDFQ